MSNAVSNIYLNEKLQKAEAQTLDLLFKITAAKTITDLCGYPAMYGFDASAFASQAAIDAFLGTTSEFLLAAFDSTAMGTDAFAGIIDVGGQAREVLSMTVAVTGLTAAAVAFSTSMTSSSLTTQVAKGTSGNVAFRAVMTGLDALTSGLIHVNIRWKPK